MYQDNKTICDELFEKGRKTLSVQDFMIKNKAEVAYTLLDKKGSEVITPQYIVDAFKWIKE